MSDELLPDQEHQRRAKLERLRAAGIEPYPARSFRTHTTTEAIALLEKGQTESPVTVAGRLVSIRVMGKGSFVHVEDGHGRIQLYMRQDRLGQESYEMFKRDLDLGDFVEARGELFFTRTQEPTIQVEELRLLSKALRPLPIAKEKDGQVFDAFADKEQRYRQRYVDLAVNPDVRDLFRLRARLVSAIRRFLDERGFLEVETPILQPVYGGAAARPFVTFHNQLKQDLYLRISDELYLKRLIVGGFERVYEIGRDFRNEGVSFKHNPEFTQIEFYAAYADYEEHTDAESLYQAIVRMGGTPERKSSWGKLVDPTLINYVEPHLTQPTFLYDYPLEVSPLAKKKEGAPGIVERFEFFIGGVEMGNAFSEINDPLDQRERFLATSRALAEGDEEAHPLDEDYIAALSYGMPPTGGFGMGIDRLTMLLSGKESLREVILFPHLRPRD